SALWSCGCFSKRRKPREGGATMRQQRKQEPEPSATPHLWNYAAALKAVPYLRAVVHSLREHWLEMQRARRQIERLDARPSCRDRETLIQRAQAGRDVEQAHSEFAETLAELKVLDVHCLDPARGLALIPFRQGHDLAWFVFDLFAPMGVEAWQLDTD